MPRNLRFGALAFVGALIASACSGTTATPGASTASSSVPAATTAATAAATAAKPVTITFWHTFNTDGGENKKLTDVVLPAFQKKYPNITVKAVVMPYDGLHDQLVTAASGGALPDLMRMDIIWTPEFAKLGALAQLDSLPGFADLKSKVFPGPLSTNSYKGKYYGIPLDTNTQVLIYNKDLVAKAPTTLDEVRSAAQTLKGKPDKFGLALGGFGPWNVLPWFWTAGGNVTDDSFSKASGVLNSTQSIAALQWLVDMQKDGLLGPSTLGGKPDSWGGFKAANYGMLSDGPWFFPIIAKDMGPNVVGAPMPKGPGGSISVVGGENLVIFKSSKNQDAAWTFAQYLLTDEAQTAMAETGQMPVTRSASQSTVMTSTPYYAPYIVQLESAKPRTVSPNWPKIEKILTDSFEAALRGTVPVKKALDDAAAAIDPLLQ